MEDGAAVADREHAVAGRAPHAEQVLAGAAALGGPGAGAAVKDGALVAHGPQLAAEAAQVVEHGGGAARLRAPLAVAGGVEDDAAVARGPHVGGGGAPDTIERAGGAAGLG